MRFQRGIHYPHPPRGPGRKQYTVSPEALLQRRNNLRRTRIRSDRETAIIKRLIWQQCFDSGPHPSQRVLGRQLGVRCSYIHKVQKQAHSEGMDAILREGRVILADLERARQFTAKIREMEPGLLALGPPLRLYKGEPRAMTVNEIIAEQKRFAEDWKRRHPDARQRVVFSLRVR